MDYSQLKEVNKKLKATDVKGKEYVEVPQRIQGFRTLYPDGFITTEIIDLKDGVVIMKAEAGYYDDNNDKIVLGTGMAYEKESASFINKTSFIENCETSAVGRALGMIGIGSTQSIASAEEVANAINQQQARNATKEKPKADIPPVVNVALEYEVGQLGKLKDIYKNNRDRFDSLREVGDAKVKANIKLIDDYLASLGGKK